MSLSVLSRESGIYGEIHLLFENNNNNDCDVSLINGIRRTIIADVETVRFDIESGNKNNPNLMIKENTGAMYNDFLAHRISLVPIHIASLKKAISNEGKEFDISKLNFTLDIQNSKPEMESSINVKCGDFKIFYNESEIDNLKYNIVDKNIILTRLRPKPYGNGLGETIKITKLVPSYGSGKVHTGYTPATLMYWFGLDKNSIPPDFENERKYTLIKAKNGIDINEDFIKYINIKVSANGFMYPQDIINSAFNILKDKIKHFSDYYLTGDIKNIYDIIIRKSSEHKDSNIINVDFIIEDVGHTICSIISNYMYLQKDVESCAYKQPHPMDNKYIIRTSLLNNISDDETYILSVKEHMIYVCKKINRILDELSAQFN
jgi:DNA-directed RNA polymerase subunit L